MDLERRRIMPGTPCAAPPPTAAAPAGWADRRSRPRSSRPDCAAGSAARPPPRPRGRRRVGPARRRRHRWPRTRPSARSAAGRRLAAAPRDPARVSSSASTPLCANAGWSGSSRMSSNGGSVALAARSRSTSRIRRRSAISSCAGPRSARPRSMRPTTVSSSGRRPGRIRAAAAWSRPSGPTVRRLRAQRLVREVGGMAAQREPTVGEQLLRPHAQRLGLAPAGLLRRCGDDPTGLWTSAQPNSLTSLVTLAPLSPAASRMPWTISRWPSRSTCRIGRRSATPAAARASLATRSAGCGRPQSRKAALSLGSTAATRPRTTPRSPPDRRGRARGSRPADRRSAWRPVRRTRSPRARCAWSRPRASSRARRAGPASRPAAGRRRWIGAVDRRHEGGGPALDGVATGLALPLAAGEIVGDLGLGQSLEPDHRGDQARGPPPSGASTHTAPWTRWRRPDRRRRQRRASASATALGRIRRPQATTVSAASTKPDLARPRPRRPRPWPRRDAPHGPWAARPAQRSRRCRDARSGPAGCRSAAGGRGGAGRTRPVSAWGETPSYLKR